MTRTTGPRRIGPRRIGPAEPRLPRRPVGASPAAGLAALALLAGCAQGPSPDAAPAPSSSVGDGHGAVAGATETQDPQPALVTVAPDGVVALRDLLTDETAEVGELGPFDDVSTDGRFVFALSADRVEIVDGGRWTRPHGDHNHYYVAPHRIVGVVEATEQRGGADSAASTPPSAESSALRTAILLPAADEIVVLDREALGRGEIERLATLPGRGAAAAAPLGELTIVAARDAVAALDDDGREVARADCPDPTGAVRSTRVGVALGCADGAVVATERDGAPGVALERVPLPADAPADAPAPDAFASRNDRAAAAGRAGDAGAWLLDTRERTWTLIRTDRPLRAVSAVDDADERILAMDDEGRLLVLDPRPGARPVASATEPLAAASLADPADAARLALGVDPDRAYLGLPAEGVALELDYRDGGRVARSFPIPDGAVAIEVGR
jgi:hypothetical protein